jgi:hypothetical protein
MPTPEDCVKARPDQPKATLFPPLSIYVNAAFFAPLPIAHGEAG